MLQIQAQFIELVKSIICCELDDIQLELFKIEGPDIIKSLFICKPIPAFVEDKIVFDIGISEEGLTLSNSEVTFNDYIICCYRLLKHAAECKTNNGDWLQTLHTLDTDKELTSTICVQYRDKFSTIIDLL